MNVVIGFLQIPKREGKYHGILLALFRGVCPKPGHNAVYQQMGLLPKILFALMLVLPGGFVVGPVVLVLKRWRDRRANEQQLLRSAIALPVLSAELPRDPHPIEPHRQAA